MNKPKFKVGDKVMLESGSVGEIINNIMGSDGWYYRIQINPTQTDIWSENKIELVRDYFSDGVDIEERYAESVKDEVPDEEVPKELCPAVEKFKKLLDDTMVNHPLYYTAGKVECIDALEAATTGLHGIEAVCTANAIKYLWRHQRKNGVQDLKKAIFYIERLIQHYEQQEQSND